MCNELNREDVSHIPPSKYDINTPKIDALERSPSNIVCILTVHSLPI